MARRVAFCLLVVACGSEGRADQLAEGSGIASEAGDQTGDDPDDPGGDPSESTGSPSFDVGDGAADGAEGGEGGCAGPGGNGDVEFSYLWAANTGEGSVSKIDTITMTELGRYYTVEPGVFGGPSRTSVSLSGNVAVANRMYEAGVTMVVADPERCPDHNGEPGIQTSTGKADVLPWGLDDCVAWNTPLPYSTLRPVQWSPGVFDHNVCGFVDEKVWTTGARENVNGSVVVTILDGATGAIETEIPVPELSVGGYGPYGAAFDPDGDYWFVMSGNDGPGKGLVRVDADDHSYEIWMTPPDFAAYGFTVDTRGRPWIVSSHMGGLVRFDPQTEAFDRLPDVLGIGMQEDANGRMWLVGYPWDQPAVYAYDRDTMDLVETIPTPGASGGRGLSLDYFGNILVVATVTAARIDPVTHDVVVYDGLTDAYTYSDMTGWALKNVTFPPEG